MSKNSSQDFSFEERTRLGSQVKQLRLAAGMKQQELADLAGITRQALSNIERGATPQIESIRRIYEVLQVEISPDEYSEDIELWLGIIGGMLKTLDQPRLGEAGQAAVSAVASVIAKPVGGSEDNRKQSDFARAAFEDNDGDGASLNG